MSKSKAMKLGWPSDLSTGENLYAAFPPRIPSEELTQWLRELAREGTVPLAV